MDCWRYCAVIPVLTECVFHVLNPLFLSGFDQSIFSDVEQRWRGRRRRGSRGGQCWWRRGGGRGQWNVSWDGGAVLEFWRVDRETNRGDSESCEFIIYYLFIYSLFLLTLTCNIWSFQKPEELKEESIPDGEQRGDGGLFNQLQCYTHEWYTETWENKISFHRLCKAKQRLVFSSTAAEISEQPDSTGEEKTDDGTKPANGTADSNSKSQSGSNKKVQELCWW